MWLVPSTQAARQTSKPNLKSINHSELLIQIYLWLPLLCTQDPGRGIGFTLTCAPSREEEDFHFVSSLHSSQIMPITSESSILKMTNCTNMPEVFFFFIMQYHCSKRQLQNDSTRTCSSVSPLQHISASNVSSLWCGNFTTK